MSYEITITEVYIGPDPQAYNAKRTVIYQQTLDKLDIAAVVKCANTYGPDHDKRPDTV